MKASSITCLPDDYLLTKEDKDYVVKSFARLIENGVYRKDLFEDLK